MIDLKKEYGNRFKIYRDESYTKDDTEERNKLWQYHEIRGKYGIIYNYGADQLAVLITHESKLPRRSNKSVAKFTRRLYKGLQRKFTTWKLIQEAEYEGTFLFPEKDILTVANFIEVKPKVRLTKEHLAALQKGREARVK
ncbi:MAG: hypothetical protein V3U54_07835 [Thermodesulfobacteriota bacterium]